MFEEASAFLKEIRLAIAERLTSPLIGTYWISWLIWNFKFVLIVFSGQEIEAKLQLMHDELFWNGWAYLSTYGIPALMAILFIFVYPYPAQVVYEFRLRVQRKLNQIKQKEEDEELLSVEDSRKLRLEIREKERKLNEWLDEAEKEISDLRQENAALKEKVGSNQDTPSDDAAGVKPPPPDNLKITLFPAADEIKPAPPLDLLQTAIIKVISSRLPDEVSEKRIIESISSMKLGSINATRAKIRAALGGLEKEHGFLVSSLSGAQSWYALTPEGEKFAVENDL